MAQLKNIWPSSTLPSKCANNIDSFDALSFSLSLAIHPSRSLFLVNPPDGNQCQYRTYEYKLFVHEFVFTSKAVSSMSWLIYLVCEMGGKWPYRSCFVRCYFRDVFKRGHSNLFYFPSSFFSRRFTGVHVVQSYSSTDKATPWKNSNFILSETSNFHMLDNLSVAIHTLPIRMLTSLSVDEELLSKYMN